MKIEIIQDEIKQDYKSLLKEYKQVNTLTEINSIIKKCKDLKNESFYYNIDIYISLDAILIAMQEKKNLLTN
jgi:predicted S18 family serine protease